VGESGEKPLEYYRVNVGGTISLLRTMKAHNVHNIVFSSSATVYGDASVHENMIPIPEHCPVAPTNPYGRTKSTIELIVTDFIEAERANARRAGADPSVWNAALLRYFNPAGAHPSGIMGEDPLGDPFNLLPLLGQVATGQRARLRVFGNDYPSRDGTCVRDYIHVLDLSRGHIAALAHLHGARPGVRAWNLGSGRGCTVLEMVRAFKAASARALPYDVVARRQGDVLDLTADPRRANAELGWRTERTLEDACSDLWRWVSNNPRGYREDAPSAMVEAVRKQRDGTA
jgi:UDP-glucose 4-epimerase